MLPSLDAPLPGDSCETCGSPREVVNFCGICYEGKEVNAMPLVRRLTDWELAESLYVGRCNTRSPIETAAHQMKFRALVLNELEKHEPNLLKGATGAIIDRQSKGETG